MRTSFVVGVFAVTAVIAGATEWASRRPAATPVTSPSTVRQSASRSPGPAEQPVPGPGVVSDIARPDAPSTPAVPGVDVPDTAHTLVLGEGHGGFRLNGVTLSDEGAEALDAFVTGLDCDMTHTRFVIEGHTDNLGSEDVNQRIGLARALAVRQYLAEQHGIPIQRMRVVSRGSAQPIADNGTQEGRSMNRRVVVMVIDE